MGITGGTLMKKLEKSKILILLFVSMIVMTVIMCIRLGSPRKTVAFSSIIKSDSLINNKEKTDVAKSELEKQLEQLKSQITPINKVSPTPGGTATPKPGMAVANSIPTAIEGKEERKIAPDFEVVDTNGVNAKLSDYKGKVVFLNFWASWIPQSWAEIPRLERINKNIKSDGKAVIVGINNRESIDEAKRFLVQSKVSFRCLLDTDSKIAEMYGVNAIPTTCVIGKDGVIYKKVIGPMNEDEIYALIDAL